MKKNNIKKTIDLTRAREIGEILGMLSQYLPRVDGSSPIAPIFSREFVLKDMIGLTDEEYKRNEDSLKNECGNILEVIKAILPNAAEEMEQVPAKKTRKSKEKVN